MASLKTLFIITISTARLVFPGLPGAHGLDPAARPPAVKSITFDLASDAAATKDSKAVVSLPEGLKLGKSLDLQIEPNGLPRAPGALADSNLELAEYWGIGREVAEGQPKVGKPKSPDSELIPGAPTKSYASWPTMDSPAIPEAAVAPGDYSLKTDYCGSTSVALAPEQDFLAPVNITNASREPDLTKPISITWRPIPNAVGYLLRAIGGQGKRTVTWTSAAKPELAEGLESRPIGKDELARLVEDRVLLPSYEISATIPAGIFKDSASVMLVLTAFGKDSAQSKDGIDTQVIIRSSASYPLHSTPIKLPPLKPKNADRHLPNDDE